MDHGAPPPFGCSPHNSLQGVGQKFSTTLPIVEGYGKIGGIPPPNNS